MTARVARMRISTVAPRPRPASKGRGRPVGTPLTALEGLRRRRADRRPPASRPGARGSSSSSSRTRTASSASAPPASATRPRSRSSASSSRSSSAARRPRSRASGRRCTGRRSTSGGAASSCTRSAPSTSRSGTCFGKQLGVPVYELLGGKDASLAPRLRELALRHRGPRRARRRGRRVGGAGVHGRQAAARRTARSTGRRGSAGTSSSCVRWSTRSAPAST